MNFYCPNCKAYYTQPDEQIPASGMTVKCLDCGTLISLRAPEPGADASGPPADPLGSSDEQETISVGPELAGVASRGVDPDDLALDLNAAGPHTARALDALDPVDGRALWDHSEDAERSSSPLPARDSSSPGVAYGSRDLERELTVPSVSPDGTSIPLPPLSRVDTPEADTHPVKPVRAERGAAGGRPRLQLPLQPSAPVPRWGWRDLWLAVRGAGHRRRTAEAGLVVFAACCVVLFLVWLAEQGTNPGLRAGLLVLGGAVGWLSVSVLAGALSASLHRELQGAQPMGLVAGLRWSLEHLLSVALAPLVLVGVALVLVLVEALLHLLALIPGVGGILYGATFAISLLLAAASVFCVLLSGLVGLLYLPELQRTDMGPAGTVRRVLVLLAERGGAALALIALSGLLGAVLLAGLGALAAAALSLTGLMGAGLLRADFAALLAALPAPFRALLLGAGSLFGGLEATPEAGALGTEIGALLMAMGLILCGAFAAAFLLSYLCGAGLITHYTLTRQPRPPRR